MGLPYAEVIGDPIVHSKSPLIHNQWLARLGIEGEYRATQVRADELSGYFEKRRHDPDWRGCNVTIPHKEASLKHLSALEPTANAVGAVNCIVPRAEGLFGYNSDVDGVAAALSGIVLDQATVAIVGGGGAARAAVIYLAQQQVSAINVLVRDPDRAQKLKVLAAAGVVNIGAINEASKFLEGAKVVINASPLGMSGCPEMSPKVIVAVKDHPAAVLFDMVYDPVTTTFLSAGGSQRIGGMSMLVGQAARAFELFFGASPRIAELDGVALSA
ncbi:MAG TPA: shikimate dehydrogenase [Sphingomicrobium sp.]|nr:shikimate dehydrogenase [Sphingomicrobium sp.]